MLDRLQRQVITGQIDLAEYQGEIMRLLEEASARGGDPTVSGWLPRALRELADLALAWERATLTVH